MYISTCYNLPGINSASDLANQHEIQYGTTANSAPVDYFNSAEADPYKTMGEYMQAYDTNAPTTAAGIEKVKESYGKPKCESHTFTSCQCMSVCVWMNGNDSV